MTERQKKILTIAHATTDNPLTVALIEYAETIASECLCNAIWVNDVLVFSV